MSKKSTRNKSRSSVPKSSTNFDARTDFHGFHMRAALHHKMGICASAKVIEGLQRHYIKLCTFVPNSREDFDKIKKAKEILDKVNFNG